MIKFKLRDELTQEVMRRAGYEMHKLGYFEGGYIRYMRTKGGMERRFHLKYLNQDEWELHIDNTVNGYHRVDRNADALERNERSRIIGFQQRIRLLAKQKRQRYKKEVYIPHKVVAVHVKIERSYFNPLRYIKGKYV